MKRMSFHPNIRASTRGEDVRWCDETHPCKLYGYTYVDTTHLLCGTSIRTNHTEMIVFWKLGA